MRAAAIALFQTALVGLCLYLGRTEFFVGALFMVLYSVNSLQTHFKLLTIAQLAATHSKNEVMLEAIWRQVGVRPDRLNSIAEEMYNEVAIANLVGEFGPFNSEGDKVATLLKRNIAGWKRGWSRVS
jgi:hypothetical protein